jgi:uncharacterized protein
MALSLPHTDSPAASPTGRIQILDILRGMALMGILVVHITSGMDWMLASPEQKASMPFPAINDILGTTVNFFFVDKSRTLFAFMFGLSFFIQLKSAEHHKKPFKKAFLWRLTILMVLGLLHGHLLFGGDILRYYAAGGLLLLLVYKWSSRALLITGLLLTIGVPFFTNIIAAIFNINFFAAFPPMDSIHNGFISTSFLENLKINHETAFWRYLPFFLLFFAVPATGIFLFGIWMGRRNYLQHPEKHKKLLKRFIGWGLGVGFLIQIVKFFMGAAMESSNMMVNLALYTINDLLSNLAILMIALGYVSVLTLLCLRPAWNRFLSILAPAGCMTLTNYVMQSLLIWLIFYGSGLGLYMKIGPSITIFIALALCVLQLGFSCYWLKHFKMGPLEWVWRYANTGNRPEFRISKNYISQIIKIS